MSFSACFECVRPPRVDIININNVLLGIRRFTSFFYLKGVLSFISVFYLRYFINLNDIVFFLVHGLLRENKGV